MTIDQTPIGPQHVIPGAEKATDATIAQRRANAPLTPKVDQNLSVTALPLFSDSHNQLDLIDAIRSTKP